MNQLTIYQSIPTEFQLFGTTIKVLFDNDKMNTLKYYGCFDYSDSTITLSFTKGTTVLSLDRIKDTFYHEKVHAILDTMNEQELSENEKFVDVFAKLLRQSDETTKYQ